MNWLKILGATAAVLWAAHWTYERGRTEVLADWSASQLAAEQAVRQLEHTWQERVDAAGKQANEKLREVTDDSGRVAADNDRLRIAARAAAKRACPTAPSTEWARGPSDLLADVLERAGKRAAELAAYADRERIAREECQAAWPL